jgi:serine/threonine-protein kinase RIO1
MFNDTKVIKKMETRKTIKKIARHGFINELAKISNCSSHTVRTAIYNNANGKKADFVRKTYRINYVSKDV